jgi:hypothetical protein
LIDGVLCIHRRCSSTADPTTKPKRGGSLCEACPAYRHGCRVIPCLVPAIRLFTAVHRYRSLQRRGRYVLSRTVARWQPFPRAIHVLPLLSKWTGLQWICPLVFAPFLGARSRAGYGRFSRSPLAHDTIMSGAALAAVTLRPLPSRVACRRTHCGAGPWGSGGTRRRRHFRGSSRAIGSAHRAEPISPFVCPLLLVYHLHNALPQYVHRRRLRAHRHRHGPPRPPPAALLEVRHPAVVCRGHAQFRLGRVRCRRGGAGGDSVGQERGGSPCGLAGCRSSESMSDWQGILAGVPFFDEIMAYAGCT